MQYKCVRPLRAGISPLHSARLFKLLVSKGVYGEWREGGGVRDGEREEE